MKNLSIAFIFVLIFPTILFGWIGPIPLEKSVEKSDLIIIGTLHSVSEYNTEEFRHSSGVLLIQDIVWGLAKTEKGNLIKNNDKVRVKWTNSNLYACQFNFPTNEKGIWFLQINDDGSIKSLYFGAMVSLDKLTAINQFLRWNKLIENIKTVNTINSTPKFSKSQKTRVKPLEVKLVTKAKTDSNQDALIRGLLVFIIALILYRLLYRARFKIKVKKEKKKKD